MSIQSTSGASVAWQTLADLRAAQAAADPDTGATQSGFSTAAAQGTGNGGTSAGVAGAAAPPQPGVLQFFQQLQAAGSTDPSQGTSVGDDVSDMLDQMQQVLQGGTSATGTPPPGQAASGSASASTSASGSVPTTGTADAPATQSGDDLALQMLAGLPGGALSFGTLAGLVA